jgi:hypothetical protein
MAQTFPAIPSTHTLTASRGEFVERTDALRSMFSGSSFPAEAVVGQLCHRVDEGKVYICTNATGPVFTEFTAWLFATVTGVVSYSNIQNVSAQYSLLGRTSAGAGPVQEKATSSDFWAFAGSANYAAMRTALSVYSTAQTDAAIAAQVAALVDSSPSTLDTLNELAAALGDDPNFATTMSTQLGLKLNASSYTAADVLAKLVTVDGAASGLDADLLDGQHGSYYQNAGNLNAGTILAARMPAFTGDVTTSAGAVATTIANGAVTLAKMANMATASLLGRNTAGTGVPEVLSATTVRTLLGLNTGDSPQFTALNIGHASDTTLSRVLAGVAAIEGKPLARVNSGAQANTGLITWGTAAPGTLHEGEIYLRHA